MRIDVKKLREVGINVKIYEHLGGSKSPSEVDNLSNPFIELFVEDGMEPDELVKALSGLVQTPEYADALIGNVIARVHTFQVLEAIDRTSKGK